MKGLIIKPYWADLILCGDKTWEIRGSNTNIRGEVSIIKSRSGKIYGTAELVDCIELTKDLFDSNKEKHRLTTDAGILYERPHAWVFQNVKKYAEPIPYKHPQGAVIWVNVS